MVNEIIVAFLGTLLLMNHSESKPVTPSRPHRAERSPIITRPAARFIPPGGRGQAGRTAVSVPKTMTFDR
jgi:hypothetical protein